MRAICCGLPFFGLNYFVNAFTENVLFWAYYDILVRLGHTLNGKFKNKEKMKILITLWRRKITGKNDLVTGLISKSFST